MSSLELIWIALFQALLLLMGLSWGDWSEKMGNPSAWYPGNLILPVAKRKYCPWYNIDCFSPATWKNCSFTGKDKNQFPSCLLFHKGVASLDTFIFNVHVFWIHFQNCVPTTDIICTMFLIVGTSMWLQNCCWAVQFKNCAFRYFQTVFVRLLWWRALTSWLKFESLFF